MFQKIKKICLIAIGCVALGLALFTSGKWMHTAITNTPDNSEETESYIGDGGPKFLNLEEGASVPEETAAEETKVETTAPTEAGPAETILEETLPEETVPADTEPAAVVYDTVPQFFQTDYPDVRYGTGTIANSGCNMTALAMVASYMTNHTYYPDEIADDFAHFIGNNYARLEYASDELRLSWKRAVNVHEALNAVRDGKVVITLMNEKSLFTTGHHFIVLTGVNDDGRILVNDPNADNYTTALLADSFENGFTDGYLIAGYEGGWIYDKSEMPEEPFIYEPVPYAEECRYPGLELTEEELDLIAKLICAEGESEPFEGQQAIAEVILNRLASGRFQSSIYNIIHAEGQFAGASQMYKAEPTYTQYKAIDRALNGPYVLPIDVVFYAKFAVNDNVWGKIGVHTFCYSY